MEFIAVGAFAAMITLFVIIPTKLRK